MDQTICAAATRRARGRGRAAALSVALGFASLALPAAAPARAATARPHTLAQLVQRSATTLLGHPVGQVSYWDHGRIVTRVDVQADEVWHGEAQVGSIVPVYTLGGSVGDVAQRVDGAASLPQYGRVVLHLRRTAAGYTPTAMAQGVWLVDGLYGAHAAVRPQGADAGAGSASFRAPRLDAPVAGYVNDLQHLRAAVQEAARDLP